MNLRILSLFIWLLLVFSTCKPQEKSADSIKIRQIKPEEVRSFHRSLEMTVAWYPYEDLGYEKTNKNEWKIVRYESSGKGVIPVILIRYPDSGDSIWLDMDIKSEDLGMLLKHSLMSQEEIKRPFTEFLELATCTKCHPEDVKVDFDR